jgi:putative methionine-R-sulfoxide reductase with GAF domain
MQPLETSLAETSLQSPPRPERRRYLRHKVHTPAYACLNPSAVQPLDLCEIVDISETGMAIQAFSPLVIGSDESFSLDLSETGAFVQTIGSVIWSEPSGRSGIRFPALADESLPTLRQWMFANAIAGSGISVAAPVKEVTVPEQNVASESEAASVAPSEYDAPAHTDYTAVLSALGAVKKEVESLGPDLEAVLQLVTRRSLTFTRATGAAIAMTEAQDMVCRASAGADAPPLGARLQAGAGFSGECIRTGILLRCDDSEVDPRVDRESSRSLGIRSMVAVPIRRQSSIVGLLEIFSPQPSNFELSDEIVLQRLAEVISVALDRAEASPRDTTQKVSPPVDDEFPVETPADLPLPLPQLSRSRNLVLVCAAVTVIFVVAWLVGTWDNSRTNGPIRRSSQAQASQSPPVAVSQLSTAPVAPDSTLEGLRRLADQGDPVAEFALGTRYATGEGVPADFVEAARWFTKAAEEGNVTAQSTLGTYYWAGRGVSKDPIKAYFWSLVAQADGDATSKDRATLLASHLTHGQTLAVQQQAREWVKRHPPVLQSSSATQ